ncbi:thioredoxin domain-containing protein [bacterium]|nr:thioredoxin domain-containing protein [bacterium]
MPQPDSSPQRHGNSLRHEKSPYLRQHAFNPVDWRPWGEAAFEAARAQDRPLFISIGYSSCHWCHVMERESFEDQMVARLLNDHFIPVKVDREERPDIDRVYISACQLMTGSAGWPLTIIATPEGEPFFSGTYFPREERYGRPGLLELLPRVVDIWRNRRAEVLGSAAGVREALAAMTDEGGGPTPGRPNLARAYDFFQRIFDRTHGGFGAAPKFPTPHNLGFLLRWWRRSGEPQALDMVERTLDAWRLGGLCDHLGGGFHRYSTDSRWLVPHFEKMLYDQALIGAALLEGFQASGRAEYAREAERTFGYVLRELTHPEGGFYCAEDADSGGREGAFYLWSVEDIRKILGDDRAALACKVWNVRPEGNFRDEAAGATNGLNILHTGRENAALAAETGLGLEEFEAWLESARADLLKARASRVRPGLDNKILADWNGLMIGALARGARVLDSPRFAEAAERAAAFVLDRLRDSHGNLLHRWCEGEAAAPASAEDYAFLVQGLLDLYEATFSLRWLRAALELNGILITQFWDEVEGGLFFTPAQGERLLVRKKELYDGAMPSANSVAALNFLRLARLTGDSGLERQAEGVFRAFSGVLETNPGAFSQALCALDFALGPCREVVLALSVDSDTAVEPFVRELWRSFEPNRTVLLLRKGEVESLAELAPFTRDMRVPEGAAAAAFVCRDGACSLPVTDPASLPEPPGADRPED